MAPGRVKRRIMDMASPKGSVSLCARWRRWGIRWEVTVRGYELSLRKADAEMVEVE